MTTESNSKRLAKNTIYMYIRMAVLLTVSLYTSRVILQKLGIEDFGTYNVIGSIVAMLNSLRGVFSQATQRFLSFELGKGNIDGLCKIFNISILLNLFIAVVFVIVVEPIGIWFINNKMEYDISRFVAVHYVLQFSIISSVITIFTTSFDAMVIAHEKMTFYAYLSIIDAVIKLGICYLIGLTPDKLIMYSFLIMVSSMIVLLFNFIYCKKNFKEVKFRIVTDKYYLGKMTKFAAWNFFGNTSFAISNSALNMILNVFAGPVANTARGISYQVNQALSMVINNIANVFRPFTIKTYAEGDIDKAMFLTFITSKVYFFIYLQMVIVFSFFLNEIISLWLGQVPQFVESFLIILLWYALVRSLHEPMNTLFFAVGDMKVFQLCEGILLLLSIPLSYILLKLGFPYYMVFVSTLSIEIINLICICNIAKFKCGFSAYKYLVDVCIPCISCFVIYIALFSVASVFFKNIISVRILLALLSTLLTSALMYWVGLTKGEKEALDNITRRFLKRRK